MQTELVLCHYLWCGALLFCCFPDNKAHSTVSNNYKNGILFSLKHPLRQKSGKKYENDRQQLIGVQRFHRDQV